VTQTPSDDQADGPKGDPLGILGGGAWAGIDLGEVKDLCGTIWEDIDGVEAAAASIEQDLLVDDVPYLEQDADELYDHLLAVEQLEDHFADSDLGDEVTERADAVNSVLEELDFGDVDGLDEALDWVAETHVPLLEFCEL
jgi:hypothetical protein